MRSSLHVVWDWNGTLLDDLEIVVAAVNEGLAGFGVAPIDPDGYRSYYTRPVKVFHENLLDRPISEAEWQTINDLYFRAYLDLVGTSSLVADALEALRLASQRGAGQSLLSMAPHDHLVPIVDRHALTDFFVEVRGTAADQGGTKAEILAIHLRELGVEGHEAVVIGDTPDDALAAETVGARAVLYDGGSHHRADLEEMRVPVAGTLLEAVQLALPGPPTTTSE